MIDLSLYNHDYDHGGMSKRILWLLISSLLFETKLPVPSRLKVSILRFFGARIGTGVIIKPLVKIKYPWNITVGDNSWVGESVWIDNLANVYIGNNCCLSQGSYLLTGNHDYKSIKFDLLIKPVFIEDGSWVGARAIVCPGVTLKKLSILAVGSVATKDLDESCVYQGNPAVYKKKRLFK